MAECHIIGQIIGASDFPKQTLFCKWQIHFGSCWKAVSGVKEGQTQIDSPEFENTSYWCHPIDVHFVTKGLQGWPKIHLQIYHQDEFGRNQLFGYGFLHVPVVPGIHNLTCSTWRPVGSLRDEINQYFLGGSLQLKNVDIICTANDRYRLQTETMGKVHLELGVIFRNFHKYGIECISSTQNSANEFSCSEPGCSTISIPVGTKEVKIGTEVYINDDSVTGKKISNENMMLNDYSYQTVKSPSQFESQYIEIHSFKEEINHEGTNDDLKSVFGIERNLKFDEKVSEDGRVELKQPLEMSMTPSDDIVDTSSTESVSVNTVLETTTHASLLVPNKNSFPNVSISKSNHFSICICDKKVNECDINCCCDEDCTENMKKVFTRCEDSGRRTRSNVCFNSNSIFKINLDHKNYGNGLFCIVKSNYHPQTSFREKLIENATYFKKMIKRKKMFSYDNAVFSEPIMQNKTYQVGDYLWALHLNQLTVFRLPKHSVTSLCNSIHYVQFLVDYSTQCLHPVPQNRNACKKAQALQMNYFLKDFKLIKSPTLVNASDLSKVCSNESCLSITPYLCSGQAETSDCAKSSPRNVSWNRDTCENMVTSVEYHFYHNGTEGIQEVRAYFSLANVTSSNKQLNQKVSLKFLWVDKPVKVFVRSGNPGYVVGKPIMAGRKVFSSNDTTSVRKEAIELTFNTENWLSVTSTENGMCTSDSRIPITFGENMRHTCSVPFSERAFTKKKCTDLQDNLFNYLLGDDFSDIKLNNNFNKYVATFGNSRVEDTGDWARVIFDVFPIVSSQVSSMSYHSSIVCKNIITDLIVDVAYSKIGSFERPQNKILGVRFQLGSPKKFVFYNNSNVNFDTSKQTIKISTFVQFIDVSNAPARAFAETPGFEAKLPHDFFYPFFSKACGLSQPNYFIVFIIFYLSFNFLKYVELFLI